MSFRLVPKSVTLNDLERRKAVSLRYFTDFGKTAFQHITASRSAAEFMYESIFSERELKFMFAIMSSAVLLYVVCLSCCLSVCL